MSIIGLYDFPHVSEKLLASDRMHGNDFSDPLRFRGLRLGSRMTPWGLLLLSDMAKCGGMGNGSRSAEGIAEDRRRIAQR